MLETTKHCYIQNILALGLTVLEEKTLEDSLLNSINSVSIYTYRNDHYLYKIDIFPMFSCILNFVDIPMVLSTYQLRFGTQVPVDRLY